MRKVHRVCATAGAVNTMYKRSFGIDIFKCRYCGGKCKVIKPILFSEDIKAILESLKLPTRAPEIAPARSPPQQGFDWGA